MGESWLRSYVHVQTECSKVCTHDQGQDSPIQTDLHVAQLIRCLSQSIWQNQKQFNLFNVTGLY